MAISRSKQIALAMVPKFSSVLSLLGSGWIVVEVLTETKIPKVRHPYHRLLLAMAIYDILESVWNFMSTWPIPKGTPNVYGAIGNTATCSVQGYFLTLSVAVPIYNAFLALYYMLVIVYGYKDDRIKVFIEPAMHIVAFIWAAGTATVSAGMGLINNANLWCWIAPYPNDCLDSRRYGSDQSTCTRGDNAWIYRWAFYFAPLWSCILFATLCTLAVYRKVKYHDMLTLRYRRPERSQSFMGERLSKPKGFSFQSRYSEASLSEAADDNASASVRFSIRERSRQSGENADQQSERPQEDEQDSAGGSEGGRISRKSIKRIVSKMARRSFAAEDHNRTVQVFTQSLYYMGAFYLTHVWSTSNRIYQQLNNGSSVFGITLIHSFFDPLQGFLNYFVYQRPRYMKLRKDYPERGRFGAVMLCLRFSFMGMPDKRTTASSRSGNNLSSSGPPREINSNKDMVESRLSGDEVDDGDENNGDCDVIWETHDRSEASDASEDQLEPVPEETVFSPVIVATEEEKEMYGYGE